MADRKVICNVCGKEITNPSEQIDRRYVVKIVGRELPPQKKHDVCDAKYAAGRKGLTKA